MEDQTYPPTPTGTPATSKKSALKVCRKRQMLSVRFQDVTTQRTKAVIESCLFCCEKFMKVFTQVLTNIVEILRQVPCCSLFLLFVERKAMQSPEWTSAQRTVSSFDRCNPERYDDWPKRKLCRQIQQSCSWRYSVGALKRRCFGVSQCTVHETVLNISTMATERQFSQVSPPLNICCVKCVLPCSVWLEMSPLIEKKWRLCQDGTRCWKRGTQSQPWLVHIPRPETRALISVTDARLVGGYLASSAVQCSGGLSGLGRDSQT